MTATTTIKKQPDHNERRRERYRRDEDYRSTKLEASRTAYRARNHVDLASCLDKLPVLARHGETRPFAVNGKLPPKPQRGLTFTLKELADILGYRQQLLYRWKSKGILPEPARQAEVTLVTTGKAGTYAMIQDVYSLAEVRAIVRVIGEHQRRLKYYRVTDTETRDKLFAAVAAARKA